jgi:multiple sugar transport system substrate-binding protein
VRTRFAWLALVILAPALALGCGRTKPPPPAVVPDRVILKIACPGEPSASVVKRYGQKWATAHNAQIEIVRVPETESPGVRDGIDVWIIPPPALPRLAAANLVQTVPDSLLDRGNAYQWQNLLPLYRYKLLVWDSKPYALPLLGDAGICYYREDWFRDAAGGFREKHGRPLAAPETWEELVEIAEFFHARDKAPSMPPLPENSKEINSWLNTIAASYDRRVVREDEPKMPAEAELFSFHYDLETMRPRLGSPAFVHALGLLRRLQPCRPAGTGEAGEAFRQGKAVFCIAGPEWIDRFQNDGSKVRGNFGVARLPGSATYFDFRTGQPMPARGNFIPFVGAGGWLGVVPKSAPHAADAFALLAHLSDPTTSAEVVSEPAWGGGVYRREHLAGGASWDAFGLGAERTRAFVTALQAQLTPTATNSAVALRIPDAAEHEKILAEELQAALQTPGTEPAAALNAASKRWQTLDAKKELETRRREYRLSLGLAGK